MCTLETGILSEVWNDLLHPLNRSSQRLQSAKIDVATCVGLPKSLKTVLEKMRNIFDENEARGMKISDN